MKISFSGWRRTVLFHEPIDLDLSEAKPSANKSYGRKTIYLEHDGRELEIVCKAEDLSLHGDFLFRISLTEREIANLAMIAFGKKRIGGVIDALAKVRKSKGPAGRV